MLTKSKVKEQIEQFPEEFSIDELVKRLILMEKIERGSTQSEKGTVISDENMELEIKKWFK